MVWPESFVEDVDRCVAENIKHAELHGVPPEALEPLKRAYAEGGSAGGVAFVLDHAGEDAFPIMLAVCNGEAGNLDAAVQYLHRALDSRDPALAVSECP